MASIKYELSVEYNHGNKNNKIEDIILNNILLKSLQTRFQQFNIFTKNKPDKIINKTPFVIG